MKLSKMMKQLNKKMEEANNNSNQFTDKKVTVAGTRLRKDMMDITKLTKDIRKKVIDIRNKRKEKKK